VSSFAKSLFTGRLPAAMVMPYPRLDRHEQRRVDTLIENAREFLDATYDPAKVENTGGSATTSSAVSVNVAYSDCTWHPSMAGRDCGRPATAG
jgi:hypothetical protein